MTYKQANHAPIANGGSGGGNGGIFGRPRFAMAPEDDAANAAAAAAKAASDKAAADKSSADKTAADLDAKIAAANKAAADLEAKAKAFEALTAKAADKKPDDEKLSKATQEDLDKANAALKAANERFAANAEKAFQQLPKATQEVVAKLKDKLSPADYFDHIQEQFKITKPVVPPPGGGGDTDGGGSADAFHKVSERGAKKMAQLGIDPKVLDKAVVVHGFDGDEEDEEAGRAASGIPRFTMAIGDLVARLTKGQPKVLNAEEANRRWGRKA